MTDPTLVLDNPFWRFSVAVYAVPGVADECLALQRRYGIDVNMLLFCAWLGSARKTIVSEADAAAIMTAGCAWHDTVVQPLRAVREDIKAMPEFVHDAVQALRQQVAAIELAAEQVEQALLYAHASRRDATPSETSRQERVRTNLDVYLHMAGGRADPAATERLVAASMAAASADAWE